MEGKMPTNDVDFTNFVAGPPEFLTTQHPLDAPFGGVESSINSGIDQAIRLNDELDALTNLSGRGSDCESEIQNLSSDDSSDDIISQFMEVSSGEVCSSV
ncbi:hypothetical protein WA026_021145 [Henosepilachna vigintioctopunctata]|uniref:Uncharacterized protein n=1 Tax=Henosepilachna vigintioctopunctata TaxID=420089 RepID=A0AAW1UAN2_9CUCU